MKSAYELAMERLEAASGPTRQLKDDEKAALAEIDRKCDAEIAGLKIDFDTRLAAVTTQEAYDELRGELAREIARAEERRERDKNAIWGEA